MRYELADHKWVAIRLMLPNKPSGVPQVNDRRVLNGIFWVLRAGAPWRDLPKHFGPYTTCYNRFVRWRRAGVWSRIIDALAVTRDAAVQMIDTSTVRVHQHGACITHNQRQSMGRSQRLDKQNSCRGDSNGLPVRLALSPGEAHDVRLAGKLLSRLKSGSMLLADRGYDADWIRELAMKKGSGRTSHRKVIAAIRSASAPISTALATTRLNPPARSTAPNSDAPEATAAIRRRTIPSGFPSGPSNSSAGRLIAELIVP
jgi:transposase